MDKKVRCDTLMWLTGVMSQDHVSAEAGAVEVGGVTDNLKKLGSAFESIKGEVNRLSATEEGDKDLRLNGEEI